MMPFRLGLAQGGFINKQQVDAWASPVHIDKASVWHHRQEKADKYLIPKSEKDITDRHIKIN